MTEVAMRFVRYLLLVAALLGAFLAGSMTAS